MTKAAPWLRALTAVATVALLLLLAGQCIALYRAGNAPDNLDAAGVYLTPVFTVEKVSARLQPLTPVFLGYAALVLVTLVAAAALPQRAAEKMPPLEPENQLRLLKHRIPALPPEAQAEERKRQQIAWLTSAGVAICALGALCYLLNRANFTSWELEVVMGQMLLHVAPWVIVAFAMLLTASCARARSMQREVSLLKATPKAAPQPTDGKVRAGLSPIVYVLLYAAAAAFIVLGVMNGGLRDVLVKAINICTECIGLG